MGLVVTEWHGGWRDGRHHGWHDGNQQLDGNQQQQRDGNQQQQRDQHIASLTFSHFLQNSFAQTNKKTTMDVLFAYLGFLFIVALAIAMVGHRRRYANSTERSRKRRALASKRMLTKSYSYGTKEDRKNPKRKVHRAIKKCLKLIDKHFEDSMAKPKGSPHPLPQTMSPSGVNMYFGKDVVGSQRQGFVRRFAYASGHGTDTIRINPLRQRFLAWDSCFDELWEAVKPHVDPKYHNVVFNGVSVKWAYRYIDHNGNPQDVITRLHADVIHNRHGPIADNSQVPGTPVLMVTYGGNKTLIFKEVTVGMNRTETLSQNPYTIIKQDDSNCTMLDTNDEAYVKDRIWNLWRFFKHEAQFDSNLGGNTDKTMIITIMLRCVQKTAEVNAETGYLANPDPGDNAEEFAAAEEAWSHDLLYLDNLRIFEDKMKELIAKQIA